MNNNKTLVFFWKEYGWGGYVRSLGYARSRWNPLYWVGLTHKVVWMDFRSGRVSKQNIRLYSDAKYARIVRETFAAYERERTAT